MELRHDDAELEAAETDPEYAGKLDHKLVRALVKVGSLIRQAPNECEVHKYKGLRYEKLKGREPECSIRLNDQWRLIFEIEKREGSNNNVLVVKGIEDYH